MRFQSLLGKESIQGILSRGPGASVAIVIGGAQESLYSKPGTADLAVLRRKGFVAMALKQGASLVPVFSFGENDLWNQVDNSEGSLLRKIQETMKRYISFTLPLFHARGVFQYDYGLLPYRKPIVTIIGAPIDVPRLLETDESFRAQVDCYHQQYLDALRNLYDAHKDVYHKDRVSDIKFC